MTTEQCGGDSQGGSREEEVMGVILKALRGGGRKLL